MSGPVNLLLLLSALLSALTGAGGSVRAQDRAQAVAEGSIAAARVAVAPKAATVRPTAGLATLPETARAGRDTALTVVPAEPTYAARRRE